MTITRTALEAKIKEALLFSKFAGFIIRVGSSDYYLPAKQGSGLATLQPSGKPFAPKEPVSFTFEIDKAGNPINLSLTHHNALIEADTSHSRSMAAIRQKSWHATPNAAANRANAIGNFLAKKASSVRA